MDLGWLLKEKVKHTALEGMSLSVVGKLTFSQGLPQICDCVVMTGGGLAEALSCLQSLIDFHLTNAQVLVGLALTTVSLLWALRKMTQLNRIINQNIRQRQATLEPLDLTPEQAQKLVRCEDCHQLANVVFTPCNHLVLCHACYAAHFFDSIIVYWMKCSVCNERIDHSRVIILQNSIH